MRKIDYSSMDKEQLLSIIENLEKRVKKRKCGIVWDYEKVPEKVVLDCEQNAAILKSIDEKDIILNDSLDNILITGENYLSLQCLSYTHCGAFDVIYIDPPYNTLKDGFMYNDKMVNDEDTYDMTKPLPFKDETFDLIFHPVSNVYVEHVEPIFKECYRILKKGGILLCGLDNGINFIVNENESIIANSLPFNPLKNPKQMEILLQGNDGVQFSHTIEEQIGGQLKAGFRLVDLFEDYNGSGYLNDLHNLSEFYYQKTESGCKIELK